VIRLSVHLERSAQGTAVWWADSPDVPGLYLVADTLRELESLASEAVRAAPDELDRPTGDVALELHLVGDEPATDTHATVRRTVV
jgi:hypothetical protein